MWSLDDVALLADHLAGGARAGGRFLVHGDPSELTLALLARGAGAVVAVDLSPGPLALLELQHAAARTFPLDNTRALLGLDEPGRRIFLYHYLRDGRQEGRKVEARPLSPRARTFWDPRESTLRTGLYAAGEVELAMATVRRRARRLGLGGALDAAVFSSGGAAASGLAGRRFGVLLRRSLGPVLGAEAARGLHARLGAEVQRGPGPRARWLLGGRPEDLAAAVPLLAAAGHRAIADAAGVIEYEQEHLDDALRRQPASSLDGAFLGRLPPTAGHTLQLAGAALRPGCSLVLRGAVLPPAVPGLRLDEAVTRRLQAEDRALLGPAPWVLLRH